MITNHGLNQYYNFIVYLFVCEADRNICTMKLKTMSQNIKYYEKKVSWEVKCSSNHIMIINEDSGLQITNNTWYLKVIHMYTK